METAVSTRIYKYQYEIVADYGREEVYFDSGSRVRHLFGAGTQEMEVCWGHVTWPGAVLLTMLVS